MARIELRIADRGQSMVLKAMLEAEGHVVTTMSGEVIITDELAGPSVAANVPVLVLATAGQIPEAVKAMRRGAYGYILAPFQPGEAGMMVQRALGGLRVEGTLLQSLEEVETEHIVKVLRACKNNHSQAARVLGIGRNTLWRKLKQHQKAAVSAPESPRRY